MFTDAEVRQIIALRPKLSITEIAVEFGVARATIYRVVAGKSYRHVTHTDVPGQACEGVCCTVPKRADANLLLINHRKVTLPCVVCEASTRVTVRSGLKRHGHVLCLDCRPGAHE